MLRFAHAAREWAHRPFDSCSERATLIIALFVLNAIRIPNIWTGGRFWAEEGAVYFSRALTMPWLDALVAPHANYLNITANIAGLLAVHLTSLRTAPYITTIIGIIIQCLPGVLLVSGRHKWLDGRVALLAAILVITLAPVSEEVAANSVNSSFQLTLCAAIILVLAPQPGALGVFHNCVLLLAALSGPGCWALLPLYALRAAIDRSYPRALQALFLVAGAAAQVLFFSSLGQRDLGASPSVIGAIVMAKHLLIPFLGVKLAALPISQLAERFRDGNGPLWPLLLVGIVFATAVCVFAARVREPPFWFLLAAAMLAGAGYIGSVDRKLDLIHYLTGSRYAFAPQVLIGLALLSWTVLHPGRLRILSGGLVGWIILLGAYNYSVPTSPIFTSGPNWQTEVRLWEADSAHRLQIWPAGWSIALSAK
jgi:hypothetical protein